MQIMLSTNDRSITPGHRFDIERRLGRMYRKASDSIRRIRVTFSDIKGDKGGQGKQCLIELNVDGDQPIMVRSRKSSNEKAFVDALRRANRTLFRKLGKRKQFKRSSLAELESA